MFKGTAASPHAEKVVAAIKEHKASESEEFKKGRKLHKPPPADDVDHPDFDAPVGRSPLPTVCFRIIRNLETMHD